MQRSFTKGICLAVLLSASSVFAGSPYTFTASDESGVGGSTVVASVAVDSTGPGAMAVQGWSFGVCHTSGAIDVVAGSAALGSGATTINGGAAPGFASHATFPGLGWTQGIVIDFFGVNTMPVGATVEAAIASYDLFGPSGVYDLEFCDNLGTPPVASVIVVGGGSLVTNQDNGSVTILSPNFLILPTVTGLLGGSVATDVTLTNADPVAGVQLSIAYDDSLVTPSGAVLTGAASGACFFDVQPGSPAGELAIGLVMDFGDPVPCGQPPIPAGSGPIVSISWDINPLAPTPSSSPLSFVDGLGSPPVDNLLVFQGGGTETPNLVDGAINIVNFNPFIRGECNNDGIINIADGIYLLQALFLSGPPPVCDDACDFNDDGLLDSTDAIQVFNYQFLDGPAPLAPFPAAGLDPTTGDGLGCNGDADDI